MMSMKRVLSTFVTVCLLMALRATAVSAQSPSGSSGKVEAALTNADVVKLQKLALGDDVVIAKIKQAYSVAFDVSTDGLVQLKQAGVSGPVISTMLEKTTVKSPSNADNGAGRADRRTDLYGDDIRMLAGDGETRLPATRGDLSTTGMWPVVFTFIDYPGLRARNRSTNPRPTLVIRSEHDPRSYYYLGRLDVNDDEDNNRSLKIEQKASGFSATTRVVPAGRWFVEYEASEKTPGLWLITPTRDLQAGEYGVVAPGGTLYEFGID